MLTKRPKRQYSSEIINLESMIPQNHFLRVIEKYFPAPFDAASLGAYAGLAQQYLFYYERYLGGQKN